MTQPNSPNSAKRKLKKFHWPAWFPYPISWLRTLILFLIAFPGARLIFFIFAISGLTPIPIGNSSPLPMISILLLGSLLPTIILSLHYHLFYFVWKKQRSSNNWFKWLPGWSSFWEGFYATLVIGLSFLVILIIFRELWVLSCQSPYKTAVEIGGCVGRMTGRTVKAIFDATDNVYNFDGSGVITRQQDNFVVKPWFVIWLVIAAYFYQVEYLFRQHFIPKLKIVSNKSKLVHKASKIDDTDEVSLELNLLRGKMGLTKMKTLKKSAQTNINNSIKEGNNRKT